jgi:hypothetical protein
MPIGWSTLALAGETPSDDAYIYCGPLAFRTKPECGTKVPSELPKR